MLETIAKFAAVISALIAILTFINSLRQIKSDTSLSFNSDTSLPHNSELGDSIEEKFYQSHIRQENFKEIFFKLASIDKFLRITRNTAIFIAVFFGLIIFFIVISTPPPNNEDILGRALTFSFLFGAILGFALDYLGKGCVKFFKRKSLYKMFKTYKIEETHKELLRESFLNYTYTWTDVEFMKNLITDFFRKPRYRI